MSKRRLGGISNSGEDKTDRFRVVDLNIINDGAKKNWKTIEAQIVLEDGSIMDYRDSGRTELGLMSRLQGKLAELGTRKSDAEIADLHLSIPPGEVRDSITRHDLQELR
jgi:hypothetical protein